jgi:penicillin-binding protein 2
MYIFDHLKRSDPQLRLLTLVMVGGMCILLAGLWWVQIVSSRQHQARLETQSFRTVRIPAVRGKILDRNGAVLAENQPVCNVSLYLEELRDRFKQEYRRLHPVKVTTNAPSWFGLGAASVRTQRVRLKKDQVEALTWQARYGVANSMVQLIGERLQLPLTLDFDEFKSHYVTRLALPCPVAKNISPVQIARFEEQFINPVGVDLELQSFRVYPQKTTAAHLIGHLRRDDRSIEGEDAFFSYRLPDYSGALGIEAGYERTLHGRAGVKSVLVNNLGYRQTESIWTEAEPGSNVVLTIDVRVQQAAERALVVSNSETRGSIVVMDVHSGDVLALASSPTYDPNAFVPGISTAEYQRLNDPLLRPQINRATQMQYQAGSTFKTIVALALLETPEARFDPNEEYTVEPSQSRPGHGVVYVGNQAFHDTAPPGRYNLRRALVRSSNAYFIANGLRRGAFHRVIELGHRLHLGEEIGLRLNQEAAGNFPSLEQVRRWSDGERANVCIGQGAMDATPLQLAVMTCALANGGSVLWPRLVDRIESSDPLSDAPPAGFPKGRVRDRLGVSQRSLDMIRDDMLAETEDAVEGTGRAARVPGLRICGKTGTAERTERGVKRNTTWFISFAPHERPRYAVVVAVEDGVSGSKTCAPMAARVYAALMEAEQADGQSNTLTMAR